MGKNGNACKRCNQACIKRREICSGAVHNPIVGNISQPRFKDKQYPTLNLKKKCNIQPECKCIDSEGDQECYEGKKCAQCAKKISWDAQSVPINYYKEESGGVWKCLKCPPPNLLF